MSTATVTLGQSTFVKSDGKWRHESRVPGRAPVETGEVHADYVTFLDRIVELEDQLDHPSQGILR